MLACIHTHKIWGLFSWKIMVRLFKSCFTVFSFTKVLILKFASQFGSLTILFFDCLISFCSLFYGQFLVFSSHVLLTVILFFTIKLNIYFILPNICLSLHFIFFCSSICYLRICFMSFF